MMRKDFYCEKDDISKAQKKLTDAGFRSVLFLFSKPKL